MEFRILHWGNPRPPAQPGARGRRRRQGVVVIAIVTVIVIAIVIAVVIIPGAILPFRILHRGNPRPPDQRLFQGPTYLS